MSTGPIQDDNREEDQVLEEAVCQLSTLNIRQSLVLTEKTYQPVNAREIVLRKCLQTEPLPFAECYPDG